MQWCTPWLLDDVWQVRPVEASIVPLKILVKSAVTSGQKFGQFICSAAIGISPAGRATRRALRWARAPEGTRYGVQCVCTYGMVGPAVFVIVILLFYHLDKEYQTHHAGSCSNVKEEAVAECGQGIDVLWGANRWSIRSRFTVNNGIDDKNLI